MKCLGLIGGVGWEATSLYYRLINEDIRRRFGSRHSARLLVNSLSFERMDGLVQARRWNEAAADLQEAAQQLERAGAEAVVLCASHLHFVAGEIQAAVRIPLLKLGGAIDASLPATRDPVGFVGSRFTIERDFLLEPRPTYAHWRKRRVLAPPAADCRRVDEIVRTEICRGILRAESAQELRQMAETLRERGARRVILVPAELSLLCQADELPLWLDESARLHADWVVRWALGELKPMGDRRRTTMSSLPGAPLERNSHLRFA